MFSEGREDVNDEERAGRPSTSTTDEKINEVEKTILANRRITVREVAEDLNISIGSCHSIFINDLGMRRVAAKFVPKLLNCDQKQHRMNIANEMLDSVRDDPNLLQRVITGDEAYAYTDSLKLVSVEDAMVTAYASKKYLLPHLLRECLDFVESHVTPGNVGSAYEFGRALEARNVLFRCLQVVDRQTSAVLTSPAFTEIAASTLEMVTRRRHLNLRTEYALYVACVAWAHETCRRRGIPAEAETLREILAHVMPFLRFLAMTAEEFCKGPAKSGILTKDECLSIFMNLAIPGSSIMPPGLCTESSARITPPDYYTCVRYTASGYHAPIRALRQFCLRFVIRPRDVYIVGAGIPIRISGPNYSIKAPKFEALARLCQKIADERLESDKMEVNVMLCTDKDLRVKFPKPFYARKDVECMLELQVRSVFTEDILVPTIRNRKREDSSDGITFEFLPFQKSQVPNPAEALEFSTIHFYY
ncbi:hypothetical protein LAZ67_12001281 [Cordylochernes scorpioides]|uniref:BACK domain-containing protein n=1 Tax=Cordylochernes scorpioides TaxID=51811 RepID=A0ABY6L304_9ARAC|nr:hypothetical protein LAZ67_12001281 [Cordylochernes scorpioides]